MRTLWQWVTSLYLSFFLSSSTDSSTLTVLDPTLKLGHFRDYWEPDLVSEVEDLVQAKVCSSLT